MTSFTKVYANMLGLPGLFCSVPLTQREDTVDPCLCWRLRHAWLSLFWAHCCFLLGPGAHNILSVPSKILFPQSCGSSVIKSTGLQSQISWEFSVPLLDPQIGKSVVVPRTL